MKPIHYITILIPFLVACSSPEKPANNPENSAIKDSGEVINNTTEATILEATEPIVYQSNIRKGKEVIVGKTYTDTLTFLSFNDDYDYSFGVFKTQNNDTVTLIYGDRIGEQNEDRIVTVTWHVDSLYEAGEGDELYYGEVMIKFATNWELEESFEAYLTRFTVDFVNPTTDMYQYINTEIGFYSSSKMGVYCLLSKLDSVAKKEWVKDFNTAVFDFIPYGDICEGYKDVKNGFYFERTLLKKLPTFERYTEDSLIKEKYEIPEKYNGSEWMKVTLINNEFYRGNLYFIQIDNQWYFLAQDFCDCSA